MKPSIKSTRPGTVPALAIVNAYTLIAVAYCSSFSLVYYFIAHHLFLSVLHVLALASVMVNYLVLKRTGNFERTGIIMTIGTVVVVCMFATGGWEGTGFLWPFAFLPFVFFLSEPRYSVYWILGLVTGCAIATWLQFAGIIAQPYSGIAVCNFFACLMVFMACNYFIKRKAINYEEVLTHTRNLLNASIDPFFTINKEGKIDDVNKITEKISGVAFHAMKGSAFCSYFTEPEKARQLCDVVFTEGIAVNFPLAIQRQNAEPLELLFNAVLYRDEKGMFQRIFAVGRDITERKKLEQQLRQFNTQLEEQVRVKTAELAQKATELEQFAYITSHDLQEPLNTTTGFIKLLKHKLESKLDKEEAQYFTYITQASDRMKVLIKELLDYSRIGGIKQWQQVDCNRILYEVLADLDNIIHRREAIVQADTLPVVNGHGIEIKLLFQNLIGNAIKFCKKENIPQIQIAAEKQEGCWLFSFTDNGIGIEAAYLDKVFVLFKRLHSRNEYEGTGIGLAHCKKIVELHGGKIWVESEVGKGSTFYFTIPDEANDQ
jgi:PAS domain S-box-containing protein